MHYPILQSCHSPGLSQSQVAKLVGLSPGRIGQIERSALEKMRQALLADGTDCDFPLPRIPARLSGYQDYR